ncbi:MAG: alpha-L-fucosidase [Acutalibacter sp.]
MRRQKLVQSQVSPPPLGEVPSKGGRRGQLASRDGKAPHPPAPISNREKDIQTGLGVLFVWDEKNCSVSLFIRPPLCYSKLVKKEAAKRRQERSFCMYKFDRQEYDQRMAWYTDARFGMFIHWGLYAIPARGEWVRSVEEMPKEDYMPFFHQFNPVDFDPKQWARAAKEAGMKYVVLTAKHHDGFCLFDSQYTDFKSTNTPYGRDIVKEFVEAVRAEGLKVGLYFTLLDWYHDDYPHYGDKNHPMRNNPAYSNEKRDFSRYVEYMHNQVREICTNYGKLDILWFDFSYENENYVMRGETWGATELVNMVRELQPGIIIDNRLEVSGEGFGSLWECDPTPYHGDFVSPEQIIPPNGIQDKQGRDMVWEACVTMNNNWGYCANDHYFKPAPMLIKKLVECVSKGGNLLLNVGPDARGNIPPQSLEILRQIGAWMKDNSQSIYGCGKAGLEKPDNGRITRRGNKLYYHLFENTIGPMPLPGVKAEEVEYVRYLATGAEVPISNSWTHSNFPDIVFADLGPDPILPDPVDTVLEVTLKE